eukprot:scaffold234692_cov16-Prasinocladus_malaysianus.AAC.1
MMSEMLEYGYGSFPRLLRVPYSYSEVLNPFVPSTRVVFNRHQRRQWSARQTLVLHQSAKKGNVRLLVLAKFLSPFKSFDLCD